MDIVINNAGLGGTANLVDMTDEQWMVVLDVTLNGCFRVNRAAMQFMKDKWRWRYCKQCLSFRLACAKRSSRITLPLRQALWL